MVLIMSDKHFRVSIIRLLHFLSKHFKAHADVACLHFSSSPLNDIDKMIYAYFQRERLLSPSQTAIYQIPWNLFRFPVKVETLYRISAIQVNQTLWITQLLKQHSTKQGQLCLYNSLIYLNLSFWQIISGIGEQTPCYCKTTLDDSEANNILIIVIVVISAANY